VFLSACILFVSSGVCVDVCVHMLTVFCATFMQK